MAQDVAHNSADVLDLYRVLLFGFLGSFNFAFNYADNPNGANRLLTINKINFTQPLPYAYLERVRRVEGVTDATMMNWFGGYYQESTNQIQTMAVEPASFMRVYGNDMILTPAEQEAFARERTGIIVGRDTATRYGFHLGDRIPLHSDNLYNRSNGQQVWDFTVVGIFTPSRPENPATGAYYNYEYFRESATFGQDNIGMVAIAHRVRRYQRSGRGADRCDVRQLVPPKPRRKTKSPSAAPSWRRWAISASSSLWWFRPRSSRS
ncbi:MAG: ABC transporter permease [Terricaulis sp.]